MLIEDAYLLAAPIAPDSYDEEKIKARELALKRQKLAELEVMEQNRKQLAHDEDDSKKAESFTESLLTKIVDNLQVTIRNIHIRYEDSAVFTKIPYAVGLTLDELSAVSTDGLWQESFVALSSAFARKLVTLRSFSCYFNSQAHSLIDPTEELDEETLLTRFRHLIAREGGSVGQEFLVRPVSGSGKITVNKLGSTETDPHVLAELFFREFAVDLSSDQYRDILNTASNYRFYVRTLKFKKFRPKSRPLEAPKQWFKYVAQVVLNEVHEKNHKWTWEYFKERRDNRKAYVDAYKKKLASQDSGAALDAETSKIIDLLEESILYEDIKFYRSLARSQRRKERIKEKTTVSEPKSVEKAPQTGWFGWWGGSQTNEQDLDLVMTDEQKKELYDAIEFDEQQALAEAVSLPKDRVTMKILALLEKGAVRIRDNHSDLAEALWEGCNFQFFERPGSYTGKFTLREFRVEDSEESGTLYKHVVKVVPTESKSSIEPVQISDESSTEASQNNSPFFQLSFEQNPLDSPADSKLAATLKSMTIFYHAAFVEKVGRFFMPPQQHRDTVNALMSAAEGAVGDLAAQTRSGLRAALEEHKTVDLQLDLQAPLLVLPLDPTDWEAPCGVLDAGHVSVISDLVDRSLMEEAADLTSLMYDKFTLRLHDSKLLVGPTVRDTIGELEGESLLLILKDFDANFLVLMCIVPGALDLPRFKIEGEVPLLAATLLDYQYKVSLALLEGLVPQIGGWEDIDVDSLFDVFDEIEYDSEFSDAVSFFSAEESEEIEETDQVDTSESQKHGTGSVDIETKLSKAKEKGVVSESSKNSASSSKASSVEPSKDSSSSGNPDSPDLSASFKIGKVNLTLSKCKDPTTPSPVISLICSNFQASFVRTGTDSRTEILLLDVDLYNRLQIDGPAEYQRIFSLNNFTKIDTATKKNDAVRVSFARNQRLVSLGADVIELYDTDVRLDIAAVKAVVEREQILTIYTYLMTTFTAPPSETPADQLRHNTENAETAPQKMHVTILMEGVVFVMLQNNMRLATALLSTGNIRVLLLPEKMRAHVVLGALELVDDTNSLAPRDSIVRKIVGIEHGESAEVEYETFDRETSSELYDLKIVFRAGSMRVNWVEEPLRNVLGWSMNLLKMKGLFDSARDRNYLQIETESEGRMAYDVLIHTPIFVFPKLENGKLEEFDAVTAYLGEFRAYNEFQEIGERIKSSIFATLTSTRLTSKFYFGGESQFLEMIAGIDMTFKLENDNDGSATKVTSNMLNLEMRLTEFQLRYLYDMISWVPQTLQFDDEEDVMRKAEEAAFQALVTVLHKNEKRVLQDLKALFPRARAALVHAGRELYSFSFSVGSLALVVYNDTKEVRSSKDVEKKRLSRFSLNDIGVGVSLKEGGSYSADVHSRLFTVEDVRADRVNLYTEIIPEVKHDSYQFMCKVSSDSNGERTLMLTVDSPKMILALDYLFSLKNYIESGLGSDEADDGEELQEEHTESGNTGPKAIEFDKDNTITEGEYSSEAELEAGKASTNEKSLPFFYSINVIDASVILLADPSAANTEAVVLKLEQLLMLSQNTLTMMVNNVGMFLTSMDKLDEKSLRIIDDFLALYLCDSRDGIASKAQASVEHILARVSVRDIRMALAIINRAYELGGSQKPKQVPQQKPGYTSFTKEFRQKLAGIQAYNPPVLPEKEKAVSAISPKELSADFAGFRLVVLGEVHELPVLEFCVRPFTASALIGVGLECGAQLELYLRVFNYARSSWEPLVELWSVGVHAQRDSPDDTLSVNVVSRDVAEITITHRTATLLSKMYSLVTEENAEPAARGAHAPYRIRNQTGYPIHVWISGESSEQSVRIEQGGECPWQFEDWTEARERLDSNSSNSISVKLEGLPYETVENVSLAGEGEEVFSVDPAIEGVHNRLACNVVLNSDNVKEVVLKLTVTVKNALPVAILLGVGLALDRGANEVYRVGAGESFALPIDYVYKEPFAVKPDVAGYQWASRRVRWRNLVELAASLECRSEDQKIDPFFFHVEAESLSRGTKISYPHLRITISSPLQLENLLPYELRFLVYDKTLRQLWSVTLASGAVQNVHFVDVTHLLLLSVQPLGCGFSQKSEFAIVNLPAGSDFPTDDALELRHDDGQRLRLQLKYGSSEALCVLVCTPYVILNRTSRNLILGEKYNALHLIPEGGISLPKMFSFDSAERRNRAFLSVADSHWSRELSLDAVGQFFELSMANKDKKAEINVGVDIGEGEGKFLDTKVVTILPRFILSSKLDFELSVHEVGSSTMLSLKPGETIPLIQTGAGEEKELRLRHLGATSKWSSPFSIKDVGEVYVKLNSATGNFLLKVIVVLEKATLFVRFEDAQNRWPYSIRNFLSTEFIFYQSNPHADDEEDLARRTRFKPIFYKLPAKSVMPYAWDYPAGQVKELILRAHGVDRSVQLAEIGRLGSMQLPRFKNLAPAAVEIDIMADGPTQAVVISDSEVQERPSLESRSLRSSIRSDKPMVSLLDNEKYSTRVAINFQGIGLSLVDAKLQELCYLLLRGLELKYNESDLYQTVIMNCKWIQLDNQLFGSPCPIVIYPTVVPQTSEAASRPTFHFSVSRVKDDSHGVLFIKYATLLLQEITLDIDQDFVLAVIEFLKSPDGETKDVLCTPKLGLPEPLPAKFGEDIYFEVLHLQPTQINLSLVGLDTVKDQNKTDSQAGILFFLNLLARAVITINDAPIKLNSLFIENMRVPIPTLLELIKTHYSQDFFYQLHKVLGSADFLGNPVGLFNNISSGVMDIFYEPYMGLVMNDRPQELGISIAKGGLSFLKKLVFGFSDSFAKFTGTMARGLLMATLDDDYRKRRNLNMRRNRPKHALVGFKSGASSFLDLITSGVSGIALAPIEGATNEGTSGFFKGIGKGIVGLPTKAAIGVFDLANNVSEGIRNTTTAFDGNTLSRVRLPRQIGHDGVVRPFSEHDARGQYWLRSIADAEEEEKYLTHMILPGGDLVIMLTLRSIMLLSVAQQSVKWRINFDEIKLITLEPSGIKIGLYDNRPAPFVPIPDKSAQRELYNSVAYAVREYNRHCT